MIRNLLILFFLGSFILDLNAQNWEKKFNGLEQSVALNAAVVGQSGFVVPINQNNENIHWYYLDNAGDIIKKSVVAEGEIAHKMIATATGNYLLLSNKASKKDSVTGGHKDSLVCRLLDENGSVLRKNSWYLGGGNPQVNSTGVNAIDIKYFQDLGYIIAAALEPVSNGLMLYRLNDHGEKIYDFVIETDTIEKLSIERLDNFSFNLVTSSKLQQTGNHLTYKFAIPEPHKFVPQSDPETLPFGYKLIKQLNLINLNTNQTLIAAVKDSQTWLLKLNTINGKSKLVDSLLLNPKGYYRSKGITHLPQDTSIFLFGERATAANYENSEIFVRKISIKNLKIIDSINIVHEGDDIIHDFSIDPSGITVAGAIDKVAYVARYAAATTPVVSALKYLSVKVLADINKDCSKDNVTKGLLNWQLEVSENGTSTKYLSNTLGDFLINVDTGTYNLKLIAPNQAWEICAYNETVKISNKDTTSVLFLAKPKLVAPEMYVTAKTTGLVKGENSTYTINYENRGTASAQGAYVELSLHPLLSLTSSAKPFTILGNNKYRFQIGAVDSASTGLFTCSIKTDINALTGQALCVEAHIYPDSFLQKPISAILKTKATCLSDKVRLEVINEGTVSTKQSVSPIIGIEDVVFINIIKPSGILKPGESAIFDYPNNGSFYRIEVQQEADYLGTAYSAAWSEACGTGIPKLGRALQFEQYHERFNYYECHKVEGASQVETAILLANSKGLTYEKYFNAVDTNAIITYDVQLLNTTGSAINNVKVIDSLDSKRLDINSFKLNNNTKNLTRFAIKDGVLAMIFDSLDIKEKELFGLSFSLKVKPETKNGDTIVNKVSLVFKGDTVQTNSVFHTIKVNLKHLLSQFIPMYEANPYHLTIQPNPFSQSTVLNINNNDDENETFDLEILSISGSLVQQYKNISMPYNLNREILSEGMYMLILNNRTKQKVVVGKLIIH